MIPRHAVRVLALALSLSVLSSAPVAWAQDPPILAEWSDPGLYGSMVMALDPVNDWIYVESGSYPTWAIHKYTTAGAPLATWGLEGRFFDVAVGPDGTVYVLNRDLNRVEKYTGSGTLVEQWGQTGNSPGQLNGVANLAVDADGYVYVLQSYNNLLQKFTGSGTYVTGWTACSSVPFVPHIAVDLARNVYVSSGDGSIRKFSSTGTYMGQFGAGRFSSPPSLVTDRIGNLYAGDYTPNQQARVEKFTTDGAYLSQIGSYGTGPGQFKSVVGLSVDALENLYVLCYDGTSGKVRVYGTAPVAARSSSWSRIKSLYR